MPMPPLVEVLNIRWCPQRQCIYVRFQIRVDTLSDQLYFDAVSVYKVRIFCLVWVMREGGGGTKGEEGWNDGVCGCPT